MVLLLIVCKEGKKKQILVLHAGSLSVPLKDLAKAFMSRNSGVEVVLEAHGSRTCARQISDLKRRVDVMASADSAVIKNLLMPEFADFCIDFATNEIVLMYTKNSLFADEIGSHNWYEILMRPRVQYGHSAPNSDPCGYRALLTWQLAERYYRVPGLYRKLREKMPRKNIRPKEVDLIAFLENGELDYIFIYRSVAQQHRTPYVMLPDEINLRSFLFADFYHTASLKITGKKPGEWIEKRALPIIYGITLPKNAKEPEWGAKFIDFILGTEGQEIMSKNGQPEIVPPVVDYPDKLPEILKKYFENDDI
jgi:molybdate/tungstate transport system substrate-binding protein